MSQLQNELIFFQKNFTKYVFDKERVCTFAPAFRGSF